MAGKGVRLGRDLAIRTKQVVDQVDGYRGAAVKTPVPTANPRRQTRYYKTPSGGIPEPPTGTGDMLSSAMCTLMKINQTGDALQQTNTTEKVYSRTAIEGDKVIEVKQVGGRPFAAIAETTTIIHVECFNPTGEAGDHETTCDFKYSIRRLEGDTTTLATDLSPLFRNRPTNILMSAGQFGHARKLANGDWQLLDVNETVSGGVECIDGSMPDDVDEGQTP